MLQCTDAQTLISGHAYRDVHMQVKLEHTEAIMASAAGQEVRQRGLLMAGESGIFTPEHRAYVGSSGCQAILVGESLVKAEDPCAAVKALLA